MFFFQSNRQYVAYFHNFGLQVIVSLHCVHTIYSGRYNLSPLAEWITFFPCLFFSGWPEYIAL